MVLNYNYLLDAEHLAAISKITNWPYSVESCFGNNYGTLTLSPHNIRVHSSEIYVSKVRVDIEREVIYHIMLAHQLYELLPNYLIIPIVVGKENFVACISQDGRYGSVKPTFIEAVYEAFIQYSGDGNE